MLRGLSLFHVPLPLVLLWMIAAYGYDAVGRAARRGAARRDRAAVEPLRQHAGQEHQLDLRPRQPARAAGPAGCTSPVLFLVFVLFVFVPTDWLAALIENAVSVL